MWIKMIVRNQCWKCPWNKNVLKKYFSTFLVPYLQIYEGEYIMNKKYIELCLNAEEIQGKVVERREGKRKSNNFLGIDTIQITKRQTWRPAGGYELEVIKMIKMEKTKEEESTKIR